MKLKILTISEFFPPNIKGGAEISTKLLVDELSKKNECIVVTSKFGKPYKENYLVYPLLKRCDYEGSLLKKIYYGINLFFSPIYNYFKIKKIIKEKNPDVIHIIPTHFTYFRLISFLSKMGKPIVIDIRDYSFNSAFGSDKEGSPISFTKRAMSKRLFISKFLFLVIGMYESIIFKSYIKNLKKMDKEKECIKFIALSNFIRDRLIQAGFSKDKIKIIPNISKKSIVKNRKRKNKIIFAGRIEKDKGVWDLIKAVEILQNKKIYLDLVGNGSESENIKNYLTDKKIRNIRLLGKVSNKEVLKKYAESKIILGPSTWPEPFGRFIQESITTKTPCIATKVGGIPEGIKDHETGLLVEPNNPKQLAEAIQELLTNKKLYNKIVKNLKKEVNKYSPEAIGNQRLALFEKILKEQNNGGSEIFK